MSDQTSDFKIVNIIKDFKNVIKHKDTAFGLLLRLKQSVEFNSNINWQETYNELCSLYKNYNPLYQTGEYTPDPIDPEKMDENDVFVFGTNTEGKHDGGAAKSAMKDYEAVYGQARGLQGGEFGRSYGIVTLDYTGKEEVNLTTIANEIDTLITFALENPQLTFYVTKIGCGISNYQIKDIAKLWRCKIIPPNMVLPIEFVDVTTYEEYLYSPELNTYYHIIAKGNYIIVSLQENYECIKHTSGVAFGRDTEASTKEQFINASQQVLQKLY